MAITIATATTTQQYLTNLQLQATKGTRPTDSSHPLGIILPVYDANSTTFVALKAL